MCTVSREALLSNTPHTPDRVRSADTYLPSYTQSDTTERRAVSELTSRNTSYNYTTDNSDSYTETSASQTNADSSYTQLDERYNTANTPLDPDWSLSSGSSFSDYSESDDDVTLPSLHGDDPPVTLEGEDELPELPELPQPISIPTENKPSMKRKDSSLFGGSGFMGRMKGYAITMVDKIMVEDKNSTGYNSVENGGETPSEQENSLRKAASSMFNRKNSLQGKEHPNRNGSEEHVPMKRQADENTLLGMVQKYQEEKKESCVDIPRLIRVEEGPILYRRDRESPGAKSARSACKIGNSFRRRPNADDSSAFSAFSYTSSNLGRNSMDGGAGSAEGCELDAQPHGARPSPLGGRAQDVPSEESPLVLEMSKGDPDFEDTLEVCTMF